MEARLLCVGDMHLGRRPSRLPETLEATSGISPAVLDPKAAWRATVDQAIELKVDAVLLAGDVVDSRNHFMEAYGALQEGVARLVKHSIDVVCVAGNHDVVALPRLADELPDVTLLGRGGTWQSHVIHRDGEPVARVIGWSFNKPHVLSNPLDSMPLAMLAGSYDDGAPDDLRTVGLLHCDLGVSASSYAPVPRSSLEQTDLRISAWFLGHNHGPTIQGGARPMGYLGSVVGLDAGELGAHGPWLATSKPAKWQMEQIPLAPLRWETLEVQVGDCEDVEAVGMSLSRAMTALGSELAPQMEGTRVVGVRPRLTGECALPLSELRQAMTQGLELHTKSDDVLLFVDKIFDDTRPAIDLKALAIQKDPVGLIARCLLDLEERGAACTKLVDGARRQIERVANHANFSQLESPDLEEETLRGILRRLARRVLEDLLDQKRGPVEEARAEESLA